ncbi:uncharacterized protein PV09_06561 [Verruconis gallopava]|uniref:Uncharacterized protein n=1 Tax=Verruconis gallopava TaxID=253628 RepID=A0A0D2ASC5_9PEZI|nr:uncharacterized protein PV09_06561 [Verruconis gallopava]KIW02064.1 hypothetical protein PV09_06561 [Verruconis gallopava]
MASAAKMRSVKNAPLQLSSSSAETKWPVISPSTQGTILQLLLDLVRPIGQYRQDHVTRSKGKRSRKRKRDAERGDDPSTDIEEASGKPPRPPIEKYVTIGHSSTTRHLEERLRRLESNGSRFDGCQHNLAAVFLAQPVDYLPYRHLPAMTATIAEHDDATAPILLIPLPAGAESKLSGALGIRRVGLVGVFSDAPSGTALLEYVRENVQPVKVSWVSGGGMQK